jgi:hypothetical protein
MTQNDTFTMQALDQDELEQVEGGLSWGEWAGIAMASVGVATGAPLLVYGGDKLSGLR